MSERERNVVEIRPGTGWRALDLRELWAYRELLWFLAARDLKVRYKQTALGVAWAVIQPVLSMVVFTVFFGGLAKITPPGEIPYPLFAMVGLLPWQLFSYALTQSSNSLVQEQRLISKVYFPRLIVPLASIASGLADFAVTLVLVLLMMTYYGVPPTWNMAALPLLLAFALATALAVGLWLASLNVQYRDVRYTLPLLTQLWLFVTPVAYPSSLVPERYRLLYGLNPMAGVVEGFRWAVLGQGDAPGAMILVSAVSVLALLAGGVYYFRRVEQTFADVV